MSVPKKNHTNSYEEPFANRSFFVLSQLSAIKSEACFCATFTGIGSKTKFFAGMYGIIITCPHDGCSSITLPHVVSGMKVNYDHLSFSFCVEQRWRLEVELDSLGRVQAFTCR